MNIKKIILLFIGLIGISGLNSLFSQSFDYRIEFFGKPVFKNDTVQLKFNICNLNGTKIEPVYNSTHISNRNDVMVSDTIIEAGRKESIEPRYIKGSFKRTDNTILTIPGGSSQSGIQELKPQDITVSILVDRSGSMTQSKIDKVNEVIYEVLRRMPEGTVFLSWFNNHIFTSVPINIEDFETHKITVPDSPSTSHTALYNAIYTKLLEFDSTSVIPNLDFEPLYVRNAQLYNRNTPNNYLIVLTDGRDESEKIPKFSKEGFLRITLPKLLNTIETLSASGRETEIWMIGIRAEGDKTFDESKMKLICEKSGKPENYRLGGEEELPEIFKEIIDIILPDYELSLEYPDNTELKGLSREIKLRITFSDGKKARGSTEYKKGSLLNPYRFKETSKYEIISIGTLIGILLIVLLFAIIQVIIPLLRTAIFKLKYVKAYKPDSETEKLSCSWCKEEIGAGEKAVFRCPHIAHWACWKENGYQCPNHPDKCSEGKQDFFSLNNISGQSGADSIVTQNKRRLWLWMLFGVIAGLVAWIIYQLLLDFNLFEGLIKLLIPEGNDNEAYLVERYGNLLLLGIILGGMFSAVFLYLEEIRRVNFYISLRLLFRSIIGAFIGFITFFAGSCILILINKDLDIWADIVAWLLFGPCIGYYLSVKTTLSSIHGFLGGLVSILFSFITLYLSVLFKGIFRVEYMMVISLSVYGLGLGLSISEIRQRAEKYFLILSNAPVKNKEFPLHKWISKSADYGTFTIGKSSKNIIKMDWEDDGGISEDVHAAIYMEKSNKGYPVIVIRDTENKTYLNEHILLRPEKEYILHSGDTFKIGETIFRYAEKQD